MDYHPGRLLLVGADGTAGVAADDLHFPNGLAFLDHGATLIVAETEANDSPLSMSTNTEARPPPLRRHLGPRRT